MKKRILTIACCSTLLLAPIIAQGAETVDPYQVDNSALNNDGITGFYVGAGLGLSIPSDAEIEDSDGMDISMDRGFAYTGSIGYKFSDFMRVEAELGHQSNELEEISDNGESLSMDGDVTNTSLLLNLYADFMGDGPVFTFITAGAGMAKVGLELNDIDGYPLDFKEDDTVFAYQFGAGLGWVVSDNVVVELKYRYYATDDVELDGEEFSNSSQNVYLTTRLHF